jgi:hypothetical protein
MAREALELKIALSCERVGGQELGQLVDLAGAEGDVDERELAEDVVLDRLRPAPADADDDVGPRALDAFGLVQVGDEAAVGRLADRARVEEDQVGLFALRRLGLAERLEHALHALGVVLVHLAPEGGDVEALGVRHGSLRVPALCCLGLARSAPRLAAPRTPSPRDPGVVEAFCTLVGQSAPAAAA